MIRSRNGIIRPLLAIFFIILSSVGLLAAGVALFFVTLPNVFDLKGCMTTSMYQVEICPKSPSYTPISQVPKHLIDTLIVSEDGSFFSHKGFDWHEIQQSFNTNLKSAGFKRGGSTLTQQLAKNVFLSREKSILRKIREAALTVGIERHFSKNEILEKYLNVVEFGDNIYGIRSAAQIYFGKTPSQLHVLESAFLVFLLPNPKGYSKSFKLKVLTPFAKKSISNILYRLNGYKKLSDPELRFALGQISNFPWTHISNQDFKLKANSSYSDASSIEQGQDQSIDQQVDDFEDSLAEKQKASPPKVSDEPDESESKGSDESAWD